MSNNFFMSRFYNNLRESRNKIKGSLKAVAAAGLVGLLAEMAFGTHKETVTFYHGTFTIETPDLGSGGIYFRKVTEEIEWPNCPILFPAYWGWRGKYFPPNRH